MKLCYNRLGDVFMKIKLYFGVKGKDEEDAENSLENLKDAMVKLVKGN